MRAINDAHSLDFKSEITNPAKYNDPLLMAGRCRCLHSLMQ